MPHCRSWFRESRHAPRMTSAYPGPECAEPEPESVWARQGPRPREFTFAPWRQEGGTQPGRQVPPSPPPPPPTRTHPIEDTAGEPGAGTDSLCRATKSKTPGLEPRGTLPLAAELASVATSCGRPLQPFGLAYAPPHR